MKDRLQSLAEWLNESEVRYILIRGGSRVGPDMKWSADKSRVSFTLRDGNAAARTQVPAEMVSDIMAGELSDMVARETKTALEYLLFRNPPPSMKTQE